jgi:hypothetical protein
LVGHAVGTNLGTGSPDPAPALAGDANGSVAATTAQIAMSMSETLRILAPPRLDAWSPSIDMFLTSCQLIHDHLTAPTVRVYLQCAFDRGPRLRERLRCPRHPVERAGHRLVSVVVGIHGGHGQDGQLLRAFMRC